MTDDLRKDLLAIVLEEAFGYEETRIRNWLAGRFDHNDWVTEGDISALQTANLIDRIECRCAAAISPAIDVMPCRKFVSGTLTIGASVQRKRARLPIR